MKHYYSILFYSKKFCQLEKYNSQKFIPELKVKDAKNKDCIIKDQDKIDKELYKFYQNLYRAQESNLGSKTIEQFLGSANSTENTSNYPKLNEEEALKLEGLLTLEEATKKPRLKWFHRKFLQIFLEKCKTFYC